ncbi:MAG: 16S rRNA (guanine(527)-N(7))-methyltransferase RsmG [Eubacteriales bacterium]|nr:16S rRNA (guanine(527)-N(7))-methyltransferase RsmG [Eubacteriales bacterium]
MALKENPQFPENKNFQAKLKEQTAQLGIELSDLQLQQFDRFYQMMVETNKHMNLTAITEEDEVISKHLVDSLSCCKVMDMSKVGSIIDMGTGAGFPGIPLKIAYPDIEFVLMDSLQKRIRFLDGVIEELGLEKIEAVHGRAEDLARRKEYRANFDLCVSRAVANLSTLSEYCIPFVKVNGYFVSYKAQKGMEELEQAANCLKVLGCKVEDSHKFTLEGDDSERLLLKIKKCKGTPKVYPRKAGVPSKNPL